MYDPDSPIVIGCTGGSGSRALQQVISNAGTFMGVRLNGSLDALDFVPFFEANINQVLSHTHSLNYTVFDLPEELAKAGHAELQHIIDNYRRDINAQTHSWGWKCPRNMYIRFIHLVRDGRDIALSTNQNQLKNYYQSYFNTKNPATDITDAIRLWSAVNMDVARWCSANIKERYCIVNFEDLCERPVAVLQKISVFLGQVWDCETLAKLLVTPATLGRYKALDASQQQALEKAGEAGLSCFGYL